MIVRSRKEVIRIGPPVKMEKHAKKFRKRNKNVFEKSGLLHSREKVNYSAKTFVNKFKKSNADKIKEMSIIGLKIV